MAFPLFPSRRGARAVVPLRGGGSIARPSRSSASHWCPCDSDRIVAWSDGAGRRFRDRFLVALHRFPLGRRGIGRLFVDICSSGTRSFHVDISGYSILDFGSAYGYAVYATRGAAVTELRVSLLYDHLQDLSASPWDAYASGVALDLLDKDYRSLDRVRYITAFQASRKIALCGPTKADVVLAPPSGLGVWTDLARNPAVDFPAAHWQNAKFVRIAIGFLCTAGLKGASYSLYFDDFMLDTGAGDADGDGLSDLDEETRVYAMSVNSGSTPTALPSTGAATLDIHSPPAEGLVQWAGIGVEIDHPGPTISRWNLFCPSGADPLPSCSGIPGSTPAGPRSSSQQVEPPSEDHRGSRKGLATESVRPLLCGRRLACGLSRDSRWQLLGLMVFRRLARGGSSTPGDRASDGGGRARHRIGEEIPVVVDRTPPILNLMRPTKGDLVRGLTVVEAGAYDDGAWRPSFSGSTESLPKSATKTPSRSSTKPQISCPGRTRSECERSIELETKRSATSTSASGSPRRRAPPVHSRVQSAEPRDVREPPPLATGKPPMTVPLADGARLEVLEAFRAPGIPASTEPAWASRSRWTPRGIAPCQRPTASSAPGLVWRTSWASVTGESSYAITDQGARALCVPLAS